MVVAIDHLRVGESEIPDLEEASLDKMEALWQQAKIDERRS